MTAIETIENISNTFLPYENLKYCLVTKEKIPYKINGTIAKINQPEDFVNLETLLQCENLDSYAGVGISIQASKICAIDVDHCFAIPFDSSSGDDRAKNLLNIFQNTYCEFSFSGTGLRILFLHEIIPDYTKMWYIKNEKNSIEFYQPNNSNRYVTVTGRPLHNQKIAIIGDELIEFLNLYMMRAKPLVKSEKRATEDISFEEAAKKTKALYYKDALFQDLWFGIAPGSGKDESERDFQILKILYQKITSNKEILRQLFESSPYYHTKDHKHLYKWEYNNYRYFSYIYERL